MSQWFAGAWAVAFAALAFFALAMWHQQIDKTRELAFAACQHMVIQHGSNLQCTKWELKP
jgi:hypothetical protein